MGRTGRERQKVRATHEKGSEISWVDQIRKDQEEDATLKIINGWREKPSWEEVATESQQVKFWWARWPQLERREGIWYYEWREKGERIWKWMVPGDLKKEIL